MADQTGWCPIDPVTFESRLQPGIHVIGDAAIAGAMPKSAFAANAQAKVCAEAVAALLRDETPSPPKLINTCYSLVAPDYGISIAGVYHPVDGQLADVEGAGGVSPADAPPDFRALEANYAKRGSARSRPKPLADAHRRRGRLTRDWRAASAESRTATAIHDRRRRDPAIADRDARRPDPRRAIVVDRRLGACLLCHTGPFPEEKFQGTLAPDLAGAGARWSAGQLRLRLVDATRLNPDTIMPPYYRVDGLSRVGTRWQCKPILTAEQIEDE